MNRLRRRIKTFFSPTARLLWRLEHADLGPLIPDHHRATFSQFLGRVSATPHTNEFGLAFEFTPPQGTWRLWAYFNIESRSGPVVAFHLNSLFMPDPSSSDRLMTPPEEKTGVPVYLLV